MTMALMIEFSDELEQQVLAEARQQQVSPESIVVQSVFIQTIVEGEPQKARSEGTKYDLRGANIGNLADTVHRDPQAT